MGSRYNPYIPPVPPGSRDLAMAAMVGRLDGADRGREAGAARSVHAKASRPPMPESSEQAGLTNGKAASPRSVPLNAIIGALRTTITDHGPITRGWIGSAAKRIHGQIEAAMHDVNPSEENLTSP